MYERDNRREAHTSSSSLPRMSEEWRAMNVSRMISDILSISHACVQYESWTEAKVKSRF